LICIINDEIKKNNKKQIKDNKKNEGHNWNKKQMEENL
jgi:hypothetical protein